MLGKLEQGQAKAVPRPAWPGLDWVGCWFRYVVARTWLIHAGQAQAWSGQGVSSRCTGQAWHGWLGRLSQLGWTRLEGSIVTDEPAAWLEAGDRFFQTGPHIVQSDIVRIPIQALRGLVGWVEVGAENHNMSLVLPSQEPRQRQDDWQQLQDRPQRRRELPDIAKDRPQGCRLEPPRCPPDRPRLPDKAP